MIPSSKLKYLAPITILILFFSTLAACSPQPIIITPPEEDSVLNLAPLPAPGMDALTPQSDGVVIKATPSDGATGVTLTAPFQFEFSKSMDRVNTETAYTLYPGFYNPAANPANFSPLNLTSMCNGKWRVRNPNTAPISFQWDGYGTAERGVGVVAGSSDVFFNSNLGDTVRLFVGTKQQSAKASNSTTCGPRDFTANWSPNSKNLTIQPNTPLEAGKDYTLILNTNPRNSNGQGLLWTPVAVHFYTQAPIGNPNLQNVNVQVLPNFAGLQFNKIDGGLSLSLTSSAPVWNVGNNKVFTAQVTAKNTSSEDYSTARAVMSSFVANNVSVISPSGYTADNTPFVDFGEIKKGESKTVPWKFYVPDGQPFNFKANLIRLTAAQTALTLSSVSPSNFANDFSRSVTVQGTGIRKETIFFIESTRLTVQNWSATSAVVEIPAGFLVGNYGIMAVNPDGTRGVLYPALNIAEGPKPRAADLRDHAFSFADGFVLDYNTKKPIAGATITAKIKTGSDISTLTVNSVSDGYFLIRGLPPGTHQVKIEATGYETVYRTAVITDPGNDHTKGATVHIKYAALEPTSTQTTTIGAAGGTHYASDQGENGPFLVIPPGALDSPTPIHFTHLRAAETLPELPQDGYYLAFAKLEPVGLTFKKPAILYLPLQAGIQLANGTPIKISYFDARENRWVQDITAGVIVTRPNGKQYLEYEINHFTWIGGQWSADPIKGCVKYASGIPAVGVQTPWGITGRDGYYTSTTTESQIGSTLTSYVIGQSSSPTVNFSYSGNSPVTFPCIILQGPAPGSVVTPDPIDCNGVIPFSIPESGSVSAQSLPLAPNSRKRLPTEKSALFSTQSSGGTLKTLIVSPNTYGFQSQVSGANLNDPSTIRMTYDNQDITDNIEINPISSNVYGLDYVLNGPLQSGLNHKLVASTDDGNGTIIQSTLLADIGVKLQVAPIRFVIYQDDLFNSSPAFIDDIGSTPAVVFSQGVVNVIYRPGQDIEDLKALIPVVLLDENNNIVRSNFDNLKFNDSGWVDSTSGTANMINGIAMIPITINVHDFENLEYLGSTLSFNIVQTVSINNGSNFTSQSVALGLINGMAVEAFSSVELAAISAELASNPVGWATAAGLGICYINTDCRSALITIIQGKVDKGELTQPPISKCDCIHRNKVSISIVSSRSVIIEDIIPKLQNGKDLRRLLEAIKSAGQTMDLDPNNPRGPRKPRLPESVDKLICGLFKDLEQATLPSSTATAEDIRKAESGIRGYIYQKFALGHLGLLPLEPWRTVVWKADVRDILTRILSPTAQIRPWNGGVDIATFTRFDGLDDIFLYDAKFFGKNSWFTTTAGSVSLDGDLVKDLTYAAEAGRTLKIITNGPASQEFLVKALNALLSGLSDVEKAKYVNVDIVDPSSIGLDIEKEYNIEKDRCAR